MPNSFSASEICQPVSRGCVFPAPALRLGTFRPDQERPRPVRMQFDSMSDKHIFLKHAKHLKEVNLRYDDDLTILKIQPSGYRSSPPPKMPNSFSASIICQPVSRGCVFPAWQEKTTLAERTAYLCLPAQRTDKFWHVKSTCAS